MFDLFLFLTPDPPGCVIALTGPKDYVSDGDVVVELSNGHPLLGEITGSGCIGGSSIAAFCAAASTDPGPVPGRPVCGDMLLATVAACVFLFLCLRPCGLTDRPVG